MWASRTILTGGSRTTGQAQEGPGWTNQHRVIREVAPLTRIQGDDGLWEQGETVERILQHGVDNVRGWLFSRTYLSAEDEKLLRKLVCEKKNLCRRCGRPSHFVENCRAHTTAEWMGGTSLGWTGVDVCVCLQRPCMWMDRLYRMPA
eukprot:TRINITY_DN1600_c0_g1_i11.p4 TRINITY_DN1600_c0_g1~~TRINITY_DN1600_c0_g1_i11.p4  ORF type:complete len:147 (-),score=4.53 TRINITY_DN1600_c0_g1_i11:505-945(-)